MLITAYKKQNESIERGFLFLKAPYFFASFFFIKKPARIMAMLTIMTLSLLVYSIAQRRLRKKLETENKALPNQIKQLTQKPTLRWVFQLLEGIHVVYIKTEEAESKVFTGIDDLKKQIIRLLPQSAQEIYGFKNTENGKEPCSI